MLTLISATPSPFARMNRIALTEKGIEFKLQNEVPWDSTTATPTHNPLEKLPILLFPDGRAPVYDSAHIQNYIVTKYASSPPLLLTGDTDMDLQARQILVLAEGLMDAFVLVFWESRRDHQSEEWMARQNRKIDGALRAMESLVKSSSSSSKGGNAGSDKYLVGGVMTIADIAVVCAVDQVDFGGIRPDWKTDYPELSKWVEHLDQRESFRDTKPVMFDLKDKIV